MPCAKTLVSFAPQSLDLTPRILDALKQFSNLEALSCSLKTADDALLERLPELTQLKKVVWFYQLGESGKVSEKGMKALTLLPVDTLRLVWSPAGGRVARLAPSMSSVRAFGVGGSPLTNDDLRELIKATQLTFLALTECGLSDSDLELLAQMAWLRHLQLNGNKVTKAGVEKLAKALPECRITWDGGVIEPAKKP
jgi:hypothetical protein